MGAGSSCIDGTVNVVSENDIKAAVKSIDAWQKAQETGRAGNFSHANAANTPLLYRVGGADVVKKVVEGFYRRLYANERVIKYLYDVEQTYLRAKQSAFMTWLFGPTNVPYTGRHLRNVHLKLIRQRGFSPEDFETGMQALADSMVELGAPDALVTEVLAKVRPFSDVIFTPIPGKDEEEEARWAAEDRAQAEQDAAKAKPAAADKAQKPAPGAGPAAAGEIAPAPGAERPASSGSARVRTCPFSGLTLSRPTSAAPAAAAATAAAASPRPGSSASPAPAAASAPPAAPSRPTSAAPAPATSTSRPTSAVAAATSPPPPQAAAAAPEKKPSLAGSVSGAGAAAPVSAPEKKPSALTASGSLQKKPSSSGSAPGAAAPALGTRLSLGAAPDKKPSLAGSTTGAAAPPTAAASPTPEAPAAAAASAPALAKPPSSKAPPAHATTQDLLNSFLDAMPGGEGEDDDDVAAALADLEASTKA